MTVLPVDGNSCRPAIFEKQSRINRLSAARLLLKVKATARQGDPLGRSLGSGLE